MITIMNLLYVNLFLYFLGTPPTPERPVVRNVTSNTVAFKWPKYECGGGHDVQFFNIRVGYYRYFFSSLTYRYIYTVLMPDSVDILLPALVQVPPTIYLSELWVKIMF